MTIASNVQNRARLSAGTSADPIYLAVSRALSKCERLRGGTLLDVGCGTGVLWGHLRHEFQTYAGADAVAYDGFPADGKFYPIDLDSGRMPLPNDTADVVAAVEVIEHLENPRAFCRELTRVAKPGGWIIVTTPNQLSWLSKLTVVVRNEFNAFRAGSYPAHLTALLEVDLTRIASECGWKDISIEYTRDGRVPGTARKWPATLSRQFPRAFSDNVLLVGRKTLEDG